MTTQSERSYRLGGSMNIVRQQFNPSYSYPAWVDHRLLIETAQGTMIINYDSQSGEILIPESMYKLFKLIDPEIARDSPDNSPSLGSNNGKGNQ